MLLLSQVHVLIMVHAILQKYLSCAAKFVKIQTLSQQNHYCAIEKQILVSPIGEVTKFDGERFQIVSKIMSVSLSPLD